MTDDRMRPPQPPVRDLGRRPQYAATTSDGNDARRHRWQHVEIRECGTCGETGWTHSMGGRSTKRLGRPRQIEIDICSACLRAALDAIGDAQVARAKQEET